MARPKLGFYDHPMEPAMRVAYDGRLYQRHGRWKYFQVYGTRCRYCRAGILWIMRAQPDNRRQIPIEPSSWSGEDWYVPGKHVFHGRSCSGMRRQAEKYWGKRKKIVTDLIL